MSKNFASSASGKVKSKNGPANSQENSVVRKAQDAGAAAHAAAGLVAKAQPEMPRSGSSKLQGLRLDPNFKARMAAADDQSERSESGGGAAPASSSSDGGGGLSPWLILGGIGAAGGVALAVSGGSSSSAAPANRAPTFSSGATATVAENAAITTVVYQAAASDPDSGQTLTYTLGGTDAALFNISTTGAVTLKASADFEAKASYAITVTATDNGSPVQSATQNVAVTVTNVNEAPVITSAATATVAENAATSTVVYQAAATDPDAGTTLTYSLTGTDAAAFNISATGAVTLKASADFETKSSYAINVVATDNANPALSATKAVAVTVTNVNDAPVVAATQTVAANEDVAKVIAVAATDQDGDTLTYAVTSAAANGSVAVGTGGSLTYTPTANFFGTDTFKVTVSDGKGGSAVQTVTVNVASNPNEVVSIDLAGGATIQNENAGGVGFTLGDNFKYTDNSALPTDAVITNFTAGDSIEVTGEASAYNFTALGNDLEITYNTGAGVNNVILVKGVISSTTGFIGDEATAEAALGFDFFKSLTSSTSSGDGVAVLNGNLDDDNDANPFTVATTDAAGSNVAYTENAAVANSVMISNFTAGDTITVSNAAISAYSFSTAGSDVVISYLNGATVNEIVLKGLAAGATGTISTLANVEALLGAGGVGFFKAASTGGTGGFTPTTPESIDIGAIGAPVTKNAGTGSYKYTDTGSVGTEVIIQNFGSDDRIFTNVPKGSFSFSFGDNDRDIVIEYSDNASGSSNVIILDNIIVTPPTEFVVPSYDVYKALIGYDFMTFA